MPIHDIEYLELFVTDLASAVDHFVSRFDFALVARRAAADRNSALLRNADIQVVVSDGPDTADFVAEHGDGVADIALACDDLRAGWSRATAAGAAPGGSEGPVLSGFGAVRHTLVQRPPGRGRRPPADRRWTVEPRADAGRGGHIRSLDHVAVCVPAGSLTDTVRLYQEAYGLERYFSEHLVVGAQGMDSVVVRSASGGVVFTMLEPDPDRRPGQIDDFLAANGGAGVQHLAFAVDDIVAAVRTYRSRGLEFLPTPAAYYERLSDRLPGLPEAVADLRDTDVLADRDEWGHLLQLFSRSPYRRRTLFYELIQRQGARSFGTANIRALYEAVERDHAEAGGTGGPRPAGGTPAPAAGTRPE